MNNPFSTYSRTLKWANQQRDRLGLEPIDRIPKGSFVDRSCPVAKGLVQDSLSYEASVLPWSAVVWTHNSPSIVICLDVPAVVRRFINRFDDGSHYQELR